MQKDYKDIQAARRDIAQQVARFTRINNDVNGNPRYYLPLYNIPETHREYIADVLGLTRYRGQKYGAGYVIQSYNIESDALELRRLESLSEYQIAVLQFLHDTQTTLEIEKAVPQRAPLWHKASDGGHGIHYSVTLQNKRGSYTFDFWDSIANKANGEKPTEYDVLACLDTIDARDTFEDFCAMFGYDTDSITASHTFVAVQGQSDNLRRIFTRKQLERLAEIS